MTTIGSYNDKVIGANYSLQIYQSAQELSKQLKSTYKSIGIDFKEFNSGEVESSSVENPPSEIYEYQNFFLLEKTDGKIVLLDGFRRLLWYNAPNTSIYVRTYKQEDLTSSQILTLLVNLNHFKFFSNASYQERGFGLLLKTVFDIDITKFRSAFDAYLSSDSIKNDYGSSYGRSIGTEKIETIKERILNPLFIEDMKFISKLQEEQCMVNTYFGAFVYKKRLEFDEAFDTDKFLTLHKSDKVLADLMEKYKKAGTNSSVKSMEAVNRVMETYSNFFILMKGGSVEKSYAEKMQECKDLRSEINKDKNYTKLTGSKNCYLIERVMEKNPGDLKFKCLVYPKEESLSNFSRGSGMPLEYGVNDLVRFIGVVAKSFGQKEMVFGLNDTKTGAEWKVRHNYGGYNSYGKKYTTLDFQWNKEISEKYNVGSMSCKYDIELWVNIKQEEWK